MIHVARSHERGGGSIARTHEQLQPHLDMPGQPPLAPYDVRKNQGITGQIGQNNNSVSLCLMSIRL